MPQERISLDISLTVVAEGTLRGRLMGVVDAGRHGTVACIRVPRNGLWGHRPQLPDETRPDPDGVDDLWVQIEDRTVDPLCAPVERPRIGTWIEAKPSPHGAYYGCELRELPPRRARLEWQRRETDEYARREGVDWTYRPAFPDDPDLEAWAARVFGPTLLAVPRLTEQRGWVVGWRCSCGDEGCRSILVDVQPAGEDGWVELREISSGHCDGWDLMPWLLVQVDVPTRPTPP